MKVKKEDKSIELQVLGHEYPPGWGTGLPYETDWLIAKLIMKEGEKEKVVEDNFLRFSDLNKAYENITRILEGEQSNYRSNFMDKTFALAIDIIDDRDIFIEMKYSGEEETFSIKEEVTSEGFREFVNDLEDILVSNYRPSL